MSNDHSDGMLAGLAVSITGAASGIGRATALTAAQEGATGILLCDRDAERLDEVVRELKDLGVRGIALPGSVADRMMPDHIVRTAVTEFGRLDVAINNAGISGAQATIDEASDELFDEVIDVNLAATFRSMRAQLRQMYAQGSGSIVNIASASVFGVVPGLAAYVASKSGVIGLSTVAAKEAGPHGVRVNVVAPGRTLTPLFEANLDTPEKMAAAVAPIPLGRLADPSELADAIVYLSSKRSSFVNGTVLTVDGGRVG